MRRGLAPAGLSLILVSTPESALADVINVFPDGSGDAATIAEAYAIAEPFVDQIALWPGTYYEHDIPMKSVALYSVSDNPHDTIIDAQGLGRCLYGPGITGLRTTRSITLQNGMHPETGGLLLAGQGGTGGNHYMQYENCIFRNGTAPVGGAVSITASGGQAPHFYDCVFEGNQAVFASSSVAGGAREGGAIRTNGVGSATRCIFRNNSTMGHGGAVFSSKFGTWGFAMAQCLFENNSAAGNGGAVFSEGSDDFYGSCIWSCRFVGNEAANGGAAWLNEYDIVQGSRFLDNVASVGGGALFLDSIEPDKDLFGMYERNVFVRNRAGSAGGALRIGGSQAYFWILHCTFVENGAPSGGHYWAARAPQEVRHSIFAFATEGGAAAGPARSPTSCLDVFGNTGGDWVGPLVGHDADPTNFSADPLFCNPLDDDYTLRGNSPCAPEHSGGCGRVGALGVACDPISVAPESWARVKARFRE